MAHLSDCLYEKVSRIFQIGMAAYEMQLEKEVRLNGTAMPLLSYVVFSSLLPSNREISLLLKKQMERSSFCLLPLPGKC